MLLELVLSCLQYNANPNSTDENNTVEATSDTNDSKNVVYSIYQK